MSQSMTVRLLPRADRLHPVAGRLADRRGCRRSGQGRPACWWCCPMASDGRSVRPGPNRRPRSTSTTGVRSSSFWSMARPAAARPTWTGCGPARTWPACSGGRRSTASRWRCRPAGSGVPRSCVGRIAHRLRRNTKRQSRRNISAHYDLGNDFYRTFLDETMTYSSAVFASPDQSLADAQRNKYRRHRRGRRAGPWPARARDRDRLGRLRTVRRGRARMPGDVGHDLAGAIRPGA